MGKKGATGWCQDHAGVRSPEQGGAKFLLERLKPGGERRLADREGERGASHVPLSSDLDEPFYLCEEQWNHLPLMIDLIDHTRKNFRLDRGYPRAVRWPPSGRYEGKCHGTHNGLWTAGPGTSRGSVITGSGGRRRPDGPIGVVGVQLLG